MTESTVRRINTNAAERNELFIAVRDRIRAVQDEVGYDPDRGYRLRLLRDLLDKLSE
ncbi:MAG: hypothetical protein ABWX96_13630 [Propionibacteriaceae bacterium]